MENKSGCLVCGKDIIYREEDDELKCYYCGKIIKSNVMCEDGHFVCDLCHSSSANDLIERFSTSSALKDPIEMALVLMRSPKVRMHGPEHHFLLPAVLLSCYYNIKGDKESKKDAIAKARNRAEKILGGFCGSHGNCGAAVGAGIFISLITKATPLSDEEWRLSNLITSNSLRAIAGVGGPRCCKRDTFLSIIEAVDFLRDNFGVVMDIKKDSLRCEFSSQNKECLGEFCPFFGD
ncbi:MAG: DUF5714 domain-containing protein [Halobacteriota archaeon]|nr:DUF5714 domain-containing protein [Halobacteriota archaeon]